MNDTWARTPESLKRVLSLTQQCTAYNHPQEPHVRGLNAARAPGHSASRPIVCSDEKLETTEVSYISTCYYTAISNNFKNNMIMRKNVQTI